MVVAIPKVVENLMESLTDHEYLFPKITQMPDSTSFHYRTSQLYHNAFAHD